AMELVPGRSLRTFIGDTSIGIDRRMAWLAAIARALGAAHARDLVHRDVKPENVMIGDDGSVKVVDFCIARDTRPLAGAEDATQPAVTSEGAIIGTLSYMAPEQLRGEQPDARSDQFAWAVVAYELLTGSLPWKAQGIGVVAEILTEPTP